MKRRFTRPGRAWLAVMLMIALLAGVGGAAESPPLTGDPAAIERAAASVVRLEVYDDRGDRIGTGSGFAAFDPVVLVTACHVIVNMDHMIATRDDGAQFRIERAINADEDNDLALCALPEDAGLEPLNLSTEKLMRGAGVVAIGSQFGLINLATIGNVCGIWRTEDTDWILYTAPVSSGSSGGPLLDDGGRVIGIITGTYDKGQLLNLAATAEAASTLYRTTTNEGGTSK